MTTTTMFSAALLEASAGGTIGADMSSAITAIFVFFIFSGLFFGMTRGMYKTAIRFITIAAVAIAAYFTITYMSDYIHGMFVGRNISDILATYWIGYEEVLDENIRHIISSFDAATVERLLVMIVTIVIIPILFILVFLVYKIVSMLVYFLLCGLFRAGGRKSLGSVIMGGILGALQGAFIAGVIFLPVAGIANTVGELKETIYEGKREDVVETIDMIYTDYADGIIANPVLDMLTQFGAVDIFADMVTVPVADSEVDMREEVKVVAEIAADAVPLFDDGLSWIQLNDQQKATLTAILADVGEDEYTATLISGVLRGLAKAYTVSGFDIGIGPPMDEFVDKFIELFETSSKDNVTKDLETFLNVYFILSDFEVLKFFDASENEAGLKVEDLLTKEKDGKTIITHVIDTLSANDRTKTLVTELTKFSLKLMAESVGNLLPEGMDVEEIYDGVREGMTNVLLDVNNPEIPEEEKKEVVKETLNQTLIDAGVLTEETPLDDEVMSNIADHVITEFAGKEELTDDDINGAILSYFTKYGTEGIPDGVTPDDIPEGGDLSDIINGILGGGGNDDENKDETEGEENQGTTPELPEDFNPDDLPEDFNPDDYKDIIGDLIGGGGDGNDGDEDDGDEGDETIPEIPEDFNPDDLNDLLGGLGA